MTPGLLTSRFTKINLHKLSLTNPTVYLSKYKTYRNVFHATIRASKKLHYETKFKQYAKKTKCSGGSLDGSSGGSLGEQWWLIEGSSGGSFGSSGGSLEVTPDCKTAVLGSNPLLPSSLSKPPPFLRYQNSKIFRTEMTLLFKTSTKIL